MPNETDTTATRPEVDDARTEPEAARNERDEAEASPLPAFPVRGANGDASESEVAAQYHALQHAQRAHEESLQELRDEINRQRERIEHLNESGAANGGPSHSMDAVLMRLGELERKIGEGASDPLLNEIVHRLAALEDRPAKGGASDGRVDELAQQVERFKRRLSEPFTDPRTDDVVLRIASLEGAHRRSSQSKVVAELETRVQELAAAVEESGKAEIAALQAELGEARAKIDDVAATATEELESRLRELERNNAPASELEALRERLARLEAAAEEPAGPAEDPRVDELASRLESLESRIETLAQEPAAEALRARVAELDERLAAAPDSARLEALAGEIAQLEQRWVDERPADELAALETRLAEIEESVRPGEEQATATAARVEELAERLGTLDRRLAEDVSAERAETRAEIEELRARIESLQEAPAGADPGEAGPLAERLAAVEKKLFEEPEPRVLELAGRLRALEVRLDELPEDSGLAERVASLGDELAALRDAPGRSDDDGGGARLGEVFEQIAALENRVNESEASHRLEDAALRLKAVEEKLRPVDDLADIGRRLTVLELNAAEGPSLEDLARRLEVLEQAPQSEEAGGESLAALRDEIAELRERLNAAPAEDAAALDLSTLEERLKNLEERDANAVEHGEDRLHLSQRVAALEADGGAADTAGYEALIARIEKLEERAGTGEGAASLEARVDELSSRVEGLAAAATPVGGEGGSKLGDARIAELLGRLDWIEKSVQAADFERTESRLQGLEDSYRVRDGDEREVSELTVRCEALERRLSSLETGEVETPAESALQKETDRWSKWASSTQEEIGELRDKLEQLESSPRAGGGELDSDVLEALGVTISSGLNNSEVKILRTQMYFLYFAVGMVWALGLYFLFQYAAG